MLYSRYYITHIISKISNIQRLINNGPPPIIKHLILFPLVLGIFVSNGWAQGPNNRGSAYLEELQPGKARICFQNQLKNSPEDVAVLVGLGDTYLALNKVDSAKIVFQKAIALDAKNPFAWVGLGKVALINNDHGRKNDYFDRARRADKTNPEIYCAIAEGCINMTRQDTVTALIFLNQGLEINPKYARLHILTGNLEFIKKNYGNAVNAYDRAIFFDPKSTVAYRNLGFIHTNSRSYREALNALNKSIEINPDQILVYKYLGDLYYATGRYPEAEKAYQTYMSKAEVTLDDQERLAIVLFFNKKFDEAATLLEHVLAINGDESVLLRIRGYIAYETGDFQKGLAYMNKFFQLHNPQKIIASDYIYYARLLQKTDNEMLAIDNLKKALKLNPNRAEIYDELAKLTSKNKMHLEAVFYYKKLIDFGADKLVSNFLIGKEFYFEGERLRSRIDSLNELQKTNKIKFTDSTAESKTMKKFYSRADSAFTIVTQLNPEYAGGYMWKGRILSTIDPDAETTDAKDAYQNALAILLKSEPAKNSKSIIECYRYLGSYYFLSYERFFKTDKKRAAEMRSKTIEYFTKITELDPVDTQAKEVLLKMKQP